MLTGRPPFRGDTPVAVAYQHVSEAPVAPSEVNETVPRSLDAVVLHALAKDPFQRYQDAAAFREALDATVGGKVPSKRAVGALTSELYGPNPKQAAETARSLRQLSTDTTMKRTQAGPPVAWIWAGVAIIAVLLISVFFWVMTIRPGSEVPSSARLVPDVSGMTYQRANTEIGAADLISFRVDEPNSEVAVGNVIRTDPGAGVAVSPGQEVRVYVSSGQETTTVPTLEGLGQDAAAAALQSVGLVLGTVTPRNDRGSGRGNRDLVGSAGRGRASARSNGQCRRGDRTRRDHRRDRLHDRCRHARAGGPRVAAARRHTGGSGVRGHRPAGRDDAVDRTGRGAGALRGDPHLLLRSVIRAARRAAPVVDQRASRRGWSAAPRRPASVNPTVSSQLPSSR